jgi:hypothetical protein
MKKLLMLLAMISTTASAQLLPLPNDVDTAIAGTVNFEGSITAGVSDLVSSVAPSIMPVGWTLLGLFGGFALMQVLLQSSLRAMSSHHYNPLATIVAYVSILFRIVIASTMLNFYLVPIPGTSINFHQIFPYLAQALANGITMDLMRQVLGNFNDAIHFMPSIGIFQVYPGIIAALVLLVMAASQVAMTVITAGSFAVVGVLVICGPLLIPFYVLPGHDKRFWAWFDNMFAYSMYVFVGAAFIFVFCHAYLDFFNNQRGYSIAQWVVTLGQLIIVTAAFLWTMFKVPEITHILFGGIGGVAQSFSNAVQGLAVRAIVRAMV